MGWADTSTETLLVIRANLLRGLDRVGAHSLAGTLDVIPPGKSTPPREAGQITRFLLEGLDAELKRRKETHADPGDTRGR